MRIFGLLLLVWLAAPKAEAAEIHGRVVDSSSGEPLARVLVELTGTPHRAITGPQGLFQIDGLPPGDYELRVATVGYRLVRRTFSLGTGESKEFEIILSPDTLRRSDSVEVTAGPFEPIRQESPSELTLNGVEAKNLASVLADDPLRAVQTLPGVVSNDDFDSRFSLRGADYYRVGLYLDDILLHNPFHMVAGEPATGSLTAFNGDMLEGISLHGGAFPVRYGDRTAGALDATVRQGNREAFNLRATASASNSGLLAEGPLGRRGSWLASVRKSYLQYIIRRTAPDASLAFGFVDAQSKLSYDLTPRHQVSLTLIDGLSDLDRARAIPKLGINALIWSKYHLSLAGAGWRYASGGTLLASSRVAYIRERFNNRNRDSLPLAAGYYGEWVSESRLSWVWGGGRTLEAGASLRRLRDDGFIRRYQSTPFAIRLVDSYAGNALRAGGFLQQSGTAAGGRVYLAGGVRWDRHSTNRVQTLSPHVSLALALLPRTTFRLGWGQYAQSPELQFLCSIAGRRSLLPERSIHWLASVEHQLGERTRLRAEFYDREDRDLLARPFYEPRLINGKIFNPPQTPPIHNSVRGYGRGFEIFVQRRTANRLMGWASYSYGRARLRDGEARVSYPADLDQRHTVNVFASYRIRPTVNLSARGLYGSGFPIPGFYRLEGSDYYLAESRNQLRLDAYSRIDARINKTYLYRRWRLTLYGEVVNLLNQSNYRFDSFNGYNSKTGRVSLTLDRMFPIIPSVGLMLEYAP